MAVVYPCDELSLKSAALDARAAGIIEPVLIGPRERLEAVAQKLAAKIGDLALIEAPHGEAAAARSSLRSGEVEALMKEATPTS